MSERNPGEERQNGPGEPVDDEALSRPEEILRDAADEEAISDEEAVLAYNANAERTHEEPETDRED